MIGPENWKHVSFPGAKTFSRGLLSLHVDKNLRSSNFDDVLIGATIEVV